MILLGRTLINEEHIAIIVRDGLVHSKATVILKNASQFEVECSLDEYAEAIRSCFGFAFANEVNTKAQIFEFFSDKEISQINDLASEGFLYIAKDSNGQVFAYYEKPRKRSASWEVAGEGLTAKRVKGTFDVLSFDDDEPSYLPMLLWGRADE